MQLGLQAPHDVVDIPARAEQVPAGHHAGKFFRRRKGSPEPLTLLGSWLVPAQALLREGADIAGVKAAAAEGIDNRYPVAPLVVGDQIVVCGDQRPQVFAEGQIILMAEAGFEIHRAQAIPDSTDIPKK